MSRALRLGLFGGFVLVLLLGALSSFAAVRVREPFPSTSGTTALPGLDGEVEVVRDPAGVPHLYGDSLEDLYAAQGYVQAQDRFYEMDVRRHITAGRLAELFGESVVGTDAVVRTLGWRRVAEQELPLLSASSRRHLQAHASGVNAYLASREPGALGLEYTVLGLQGALPAPEPWSPVDSLAWLKAMAWDLSDARTQELEWTQLSRLLGTERAGELYPAPDLGTNRAVLPGGGLRNGVFDAAATAPDGRPGTGLPSLPTPATEALQRAGAAAGALSALTGAAGAGEGIGSNSWVLSGEHTASGAPLLSNDPHLAIGIPSTFHQIGLHCRTLSASCPLDVSGFSFAGVPGVVIGHNQSIAWGFTTPYLDTEDYVVERVHEGDSVLRPDGWEPLEVRTESITVRGEEQPRTITVRVGEHGPLLSDVDEQVAALAVGEGAADPAPDPDGTDDPVGTDEEYAAALMSTALRPGPSMDAIFGINLATDFDQFRDAVRSLRAPSQNLVYADTEGTIGYQLPGDVPVREGRDGRTPALGWTGGAAWTGTVEFEQLPSAENPVEGFLVSANQPVVGPDYPYRLHTDPSQGWRSQQLRERLTELTADGGTVDTDEAEQLFYDTRMRYADALVDPLVQAPALEPWVRDGQRVLADWDRRADPDSAGAAYFHVVVREVLRLTFNDELPPSSWPSGGDRWMAVLADLVADPDNPWWDDATTPDVVEDRDDVLAAANLAARKQITALMSRDPGGWSWGQLHTIELTHQTLGTSGIGVVEALFNRDGPEVGGSTGTVNAMSWDARAPGFTPVSGPTMRMLVDLSDLDGSRWINQTGVSGHAFHPHYDDQSELWARDEMMPFVHSTEAVHAAGTDTLVLAPGG